MPKLEADQLLDKALSISDSAVKAIFIDNKKANQVAQKISLGPFIQEILKHQDKLPRFPYNHYTIFHSNCLWEALKKKADDPKHVEIYMSSSENDPMHFIWKQHDKFYHFRRAFGKARTEVFLEGYIEPYPATEKLTHLIRVDTFLDEENENSHWYQHLKDLFQLFTS